MSATRRLACPKCATEMEVVTHAEVEVDRCPGCGGFFFDRCEHEDLRAAGGAGSLEAGGRIIGRILDMTRDLRCPACRRRMVSLVATGGRAFAYEKCAGCAGVYFDAGELSDFVRGGGVFASILAAVRGSS